MAGNNSQINLVGFKELEAALLKLPKELSDKVEPVALRYGMTPLRKAVQGNARAAKETGQLYKSIGLNVRRIRSKGQYSNRYTARVGPRAGFAIVMGHYKRGKKKGRPIRRDPRYYAHLIEYGTSRMAAKPFIRAALSSSETAIMDGLVKGYNIGLDRVVAKLRRK
jgi:HK97 gp10 family phage protein